MITGGNTGIGFESAKELALRNPAKIILACRDLNRGMKAVNDIKSSTGF
jgi:retinol dehydrogenase 12